ncbi:hypothetical protein U1Q18_052805 [Sarracenia purpurea var. burkii]
MLPNIFKMFYYILIFLMNPNVPNDDDDIEEIPDPTFPTYHHTRSSAASASASGSSPSPASVSTRKPSAVWEFFEKIYETRENGVSVLVKAKCKLCARTLSAATSSGTKHLWRHKERHIKNNPVDPTRQMQLGIDALGNVANWKYNPITAQAGIIDWVVDEELPLRITETDSFQNMVRTHLNPQFEKFSRNTSRNRILERFENIRTDLMNVFENVRGKICLTSDMWTAKQELVYMCLTAHFIDNEWNLNKRIIAFHPMDHHPIDGKSIAIEIRNVIMYWGLSNKIFSITLDNAAYYNEVISYLKRHLTLPIDGKLFHNRCCAHIINLVVQDGLRFHDKSIYKIKNAIKYISVSAKKNRYV